MELANLLFRGHRSSDSNVIAIVTCQMSHVTLLTQVTAVTGSQYHHGVCRQRCTGVWHGHRQDHSVLSGPRRQCGPHRRPRQLDRHSGYRQVKTASCSFLPKSCRLSNHNFVNVSASLQTGVGRTRMWVKTMFIISLAVHSTQLHDVLAQLKVKTRLKLEVREEMLSSRQNPQEQPE